MMTEPFAYAGEPKLPPSDVVVTNCPFVSSTYKLPSFAPKMTCPFGSIAGEERIAAFEGIVYVQRGDPEGTFTELIVPPSFPKYATLFTTAGDVLIGAPELYIQ